MRFSFRVRGSTLHAEAAARHGERSPKSRIELADHLDWSAVAGVAPLKGIGFTVAIFISLLAFRRRGAARAATLAILVASFVAGAIGLVVLSLRHRLRRRQAADGERSPWPAASPAVSVRPGRTGRRH
jgi:hypothetical protein